MATVVVSGAIANKLFNGGEAWVRLNWLLGLKELGCRVHFIEQISRETCRDAAGEPAEFENSANLGYFKQIAGQFGLDGSAALVYEDGEQVYGATYPELLDLAEEADLLVNISGHLSLEPLMRRLRKKVYLDIDPGFTQFWLAMPGTGFQPGKHDFYYTIGENIGSPHCAIPAAGIEWRHTRPPVVLGEWPASTAGRGDRFTTVASWRGPFGPIEYEGRTFGLKVHEFRKFARMPELASQEFEIALSIHPADQKDLEMLIEHGWRIVEPSTVAHGPEAFRNYVQGSGAEFSVAQGVYVQTGSGWFSDRTVRYLASGKPALVQDTGFSRNYPVGEGLLAFSSLEDAARGAASLARNYDAHCRAARALAEEYFDARKVIGRLVEEVGI